MTLLELLPGQLKRVSASKGGEYHGPCPLCGGTDRFHVWPEQGEHGSWWCRGCAKGGDAIQYLRDIEGMGYKAACARLGVEPQAAPAANQIPAQRQAQTFTPTQVSAPEDVWSTKAGAFVKYCHEQLLNNPDQLTWLAQRGIDAVQVVKFRLGFNPANAWRERTAWGLPVELKPETGKPKKLWLPLGLVIPVLADGLVVQLRIRRPDGDLRYFVVPGSNRAPLITRRDAEAFVVVESGLDAILLDGLAGDLVGVVAMGNDSAKPSADLFPLLAQAAHLSICLDSDATRKNPTTGKMESPGAKSSLWWLSQFRQAERIPVIGGKDPGDAFKAGVDLRAWVLAGLPPRFHVGNVPQPKQETTTSHDYQVVTLTDGREIHVVKDEALWKELTADGKLVFSENEMKRLQVVMAGAGEDERQEMVNALLDAKSAFGSAYIRAGRVAA
ncbi:MAG: CHC2 zinc finger domain-containing protein [Deltaproteobacteria bacterium]|nr:CHC2 zinc finger domain-containing protein [Deltaproteobacteria bacterium]